MVGFRPRRRIAVFFPPVWKIGRCVLREPDLLLPISQATLWRPDEPDRRLKTDDVNPAAERDDERASQHAATFVFHDRAERSSKAEQRRTHGLPQSCLAHCLHQTSNFGEIPGRTKLDRLGADPKVNVRCPHRLCPD